MGLVHGEPTRRENEAVLEGRQVQDVIGARVSIGAGANAGLLTLLESDQRPFDVPKEDLLASRGAFETDSWSRTGWLQSRLMQAVRSFVSLRRGLEASLAVLERLAGSQKRP